MVSLKCSQQVPNHRTAGAPAALRTAGVTRRGVRPMDTRTYMSTGTHKPNGDPEEATLWGGSSRR